MLAFLFKLVQMVSSMFNPALWINESTRGSGEETGTLDEGTPSSSSHNDPSHATSSTPEHTMIQVEDNLQAHVSAQSPVLASVERIPPPSNGCHVLQVRAADSEVPWVASNHQEAESTATFSRQAITIDASTPTSFSIQATTRDASQTTGAPEMLSSIDNTNHAAGVSVAHWVIGVSATGVITVLAGFLGNQTSKPAHHFLFKASMCSMLASFFLGLAIFLFSTICPQSSNVLSVMVKILAVLIMVSTALVVGFGAAFYFQKS